MTSAHKTPLALAVVAAALMMMASPGAYALSINTSDGSTLSPPRDQDVLTRIMGHTPTPTEIRTYLDEYGRVPTDQEINAYLEARPAETSSPEKTGSNSTTPSSSRTSTRGPGPTPNPVSFQTFFKWGKWINRSGVISLSLEPRDGGIGSEGDDRTWGTVWRKFGNDTNWKKYGSGVYKSMEKQYKCHFKYGMIKHPWNLEPSKKAEDISFWTCN